MLERLAQELPALFGYYNVVFMAKAALATLALSAVGCLVGTALALGLVLVRLTSGWTLAPLRWFAIFFVEVFRRVPFLVTLMLVFFAFQLSGADLPLFAVAAASVRRRSTSRSPSR